MRLPRPIEQPSATFQPWGGAPPAEGLTPFPGSGGAGLPATDPGSFDPNKYGRIEQLKARKQQLEGAMRQPDVFYDQQGPSAQLARIGMAGTAMAEQGAEAIFPKGPEEAAGLRSPFSLQGASNSVAENLPQLIAQLIIGQAAPNAPSKIQRFAGSGVPLSLSQSFSGGTEAIKGHGVGELEAARRASTGATVDAIGDYLLDRVGAGGIFPEKAATGGVAKRVAKGAGIDGHGGLRPETAR